MSNSEFNDEMLLGDSAFNVPPFNIRLSDDIAISLDDDAIIVPPFTVRLVQVMARAFLLSTLS